MVYNSWIRNFAFRSCIANERNNTTVPSGRSMDNSLRQAYSRSEIRRLTTDTNTGQSPKLVLVLLLFNILHSFRGDF